MTTTTATAPIDINFDQIRRFAEKVGRRYSTYDDRGRADLDSLVEQLGGRVEASTADSRADFIAVKVEDRDDFTITTYEARGDRRRRFDTAVYLGLYLLHYVVAGRSGRSDFALRIEGPGGTQANVFAATLLMPRDEFRTAWNELGGDIDALADRFDVSPAAARERARVLALSGKNRARRRRR